MLASPLLATQDGSIQGRIGPPELLEWLRQDAFLPAKFEDVGEEEFEHDRERAPQVLASCRSDPEVETRVVRLGSQGGFRFEALPPGRYSLAVRRWEAGWSFSQPVGPTGYAILDRRFGDEVTVAAGQQTEVGVDLASWLPRPVELTVTMNGEPYRGEPRVQMRRSDALDGFEGMGRSILFDWRHPAHVRLQPGEWTVDLVTIRSARAVIHGPSFVVADAPGNSAELDFAAGRAPVIVLDPDGRPVVGLRLSIGSSDGEIPSNQVRTGRLGRAEFGGPLGEVMVRAVREPLMRSPALWEWRHACTDAGRIDLLVQEEVEVGLVTIEELPLRSTVLRLPAAWRELPK